MPAILDEEQTVDFSTNDSHIHLDHDAPARRARLRMELKPGETDEVSVPGTRYQCKQCNPDGTLEPLVRANNGTYDLSASRRKQDEVTELRRELAEMKELMNLQMDGQKTSRKEKTA